MPLPLNRIGGCAAAGRRLARRQHVPACAAAPSFQACASRLIICLPPSCGARMRFQGNVAAAAQERKPNVRCGPRPAGHMRPALSHQALNRAPQLHRMYCMMPRAQSTRMWVLHLHGGVLRHKWIRCEALTDAMSSRVDGFRADTQSQLPRPSRSCMHHPGKDWSLV